AAARPRPRRAPQGLACAAETCKADRRRTRTGSRTAMTETSAADGVERDLYDSYLYINREISWLQFNDRVLAMAADPEVPLLERLKYLAIFSTNLDEFFMVRVSGLRDQVQAGMVTRGSDGWTPSETLEAIAKHVGPAIEYQVRVFLDEVVPALAEARIRTAAMCHP